MKNSEDLLEQHHYRRLMRLKGKIPTSAIMSKMTRDHTAKAEVDTRGMAVTITRTAETTTRPTGKETTITVVVVPIIAVAEVVMAVVEAAYPNHLT
uniref:Uncharacterized protein n=1 Tax=Brassica oleracea var. oleracea TaxID=109376 RepID=A0A0D3E9K6_BRAOL